MSEGLQRALFPLFDGVSNCTVALQAPLEHSREHWDLKVHIIVDLNDALVVVQSMQAAYVLLQRASPRNGHDQKQRIEPGIVEAFANVATGGQNYPLLVFWYSG